jgi:hypothetical protein
MFYCLGASHILLLILQIVIIIIIAFVLYRFMLNWSDITSKFRNLALIMLTYKQYKQGFRLYRLCMIYLHSKFNIPSVSGSLVISIKPRDKYRRERVIVTQWVIVRTSNLKLREVMNSSTSYCNVAEACKN